MNFIIKFKCTLCIDVTNCKEQKLIQNNNNLKQVAILKSANGFTKEIFLRRQFDFSFLFLIIHHNTAVLNI